MDETNLPIGLTYTIVLERVFYIGIGIFFFSAIFRSIVNNKKSESKIKNIIEKLNEK